MKRYGYIYEKIYDIENLKEAHKRARKDKLYYKEVKMVDENLDYYLNEIHDMLKNETYTLSESNYSVSVIQDGPKERELWKLKYYPHRIIQWAIMLQLEPIFNEVFTSSVYASIPGKGIHGVVKKIEKDLKDDKNTVYCAKGDVKKFYQNINHNILKKMLRKKIKDKKLLRLLDIIINSHGKIGIPIGSYLSQYLANFYLAYFDHWVLSQKEVKYYYRYMDDIVILGSNKEGLHKVVNDIKIYLNEELKVTLKENYQVFPVKTRGIDFCGYRFFKTRTILRKSTYIKMRAKMSQINKKWNSGNMINYNEWSSINSYYGWTKWLKNCKLQEKYVNINIDAMNHYYKNVIKRRKLLKKL